MTNLDSVSTGENPPTPIVAAPLPFPTRINYAVRLWAYKIMVYLLLRFFRFFKPMPPSMRPTFTKTYPVRPTIVNRVFIPRSYESNNKLLPLYISIHGGGFALCDPQVDDEFASTFANKYEICVVSIGYRLAPRHRFPSQVYDCAAIVQAVIEDESIPVDRQKVVLGGFSAGGNLSLSISQLPSLKGKIAAVVCFYPVVDFTRPTEQMMRERPAIPGKQDLLENSSNWFGWGYLPTGIDRRNPLLSPIFAKRADLPEKMYFIGAEQDMLCKGAEDMAERLGGLESGQKETLKSAVGWDKGGIRWEKVMGWEHGFDHIRAKGKREEERLKLTTEVRERVATWLRNEVDLHKSVINVLVGTGGSQVNFAIHKELAAHYSSFFLTATQGSWTEAKTGVVDLPDDSPQVFAVFENWLYTQECDLIGLSPEQDHDNNKNDNKQSVVKKKYNFGFIFDIYIFGDKIGAPSFQNKTMDALKIAFGNASYLPSANLVTHIYLNTPTSSPLRQCLVDGFLCYAELFTNANDYPKEFLEDLVVQYAPIVHNQWSVKELKRKVLDEDYHVVAVNAADSCQD